MISSKSPGEVRKKNSFWEKSQDNEKKLEDFLRSTLRRFHHFFLPTLRRISNYSTLRKFSDAQQLDSIEETSPLGRFHRSRSDFAFHHWAWRHRQLFEELRLRISSLALVKKKKVSTLEYERLQLLHRRNRSIRIEQPWRKKKSVQDAEKNEHFSLHPTTTNLANDETEEKEEHLQTFSPAK